MISSSLETKTNIELKFASDRELSRFMKTQIAGNLISFN